MKNLAQAIGGGIAVLVFAGILTVLCIRGSKKHPVTTYIGG